MEALFGDTSAFVASSVSVSFHFSPAGRMFLDSCG